MSLFHRFLWMPAFVGISFAVCTDAPAQTGSVLPFSQDLARQVDALFAAFDRSDTPGYAVGIVQEGELVYARGFGSANLDYGIPIAPHTVFNVASISKQFTACALALLILEGK